MNKIKRLTAAALLLFASTTLVHAQGADVEWKRLNQEAARLHLQAKYNQAVIFYQKALEVAQADTNHSAVAISLNNLAILYQDQGDYAKAEPLLKRSLAIDEKLLGADHPDVAIDLNHLGGLYINQGDYAKAEPLLKRSLVIFEKALGADHPHVASALSGLAALYFNQDGYAKAEPLFRRSLAIQEKALGADHPDVAQSLENLAALYRAMRRESEALELDNRAKQIRAIRH